MKIDNIVIRCDCINGTQYWIVYLYNDRGDKMGSKSFTKWEDAGEYAMKFETFWKYRRG